MRNQEKIPTVKFIYNLCSLKGFATLILEESTRLAFPSPLCIRNTDNWAQPPWFWFTDILKPVSRKLLHIEGWDSLPQTPLHIPASIINLWLLLTFVPNHFLWTDVKSFALLVLAFSILWKESMVSTVCIFSKLHSSQHVIKHECFPPASQHSHLERCPWVQGTQACSVPPHFRLDRSYALVGSTAILRLESFCESSECHLTLKHLHTFAFSGFIALKSSSIDFDGSKNLAFGISKMMPFRDWGF